MLKAFGDEIWVADGPEVSVAGFCYPTRMVVIRLSDGTLFIWSPVQLTDDLRSDVDALGPVGHLVAPNSLHHLFLSAWKKAYPAAKLHAPPGLRAKREDIIFDADLGEQPDVAWLGDIDQVAMIGNVITTEIVFFHKRSGTVIFADLLQRIPGHLLFGWRKIVAKLDRMTGPEPAVPRKFRIAFINRKHARHALQRILDWPSEKVLMAHGEPVQQDAQTFLRRAFRWLGPSRVGINHRSENVRPNGSIGL